MTKEEFKALCFDKASNISKADFVKIIKCKLYDEDAIDIPNSPKEALQMLINIGTVFYIFKDQALSNKCFPSDEAKRVALKKFKFKVLEGYDCYFWNFEDKHKIASPTEWPFDCTDTQIELFCELMQMSDKMLDIKFNALFIRVQQLYEVFGSELRG